MILFLMFLLIKIELEAGSLTNCSFVNDGVTSISFKPFPISNIDLARAKRQAPVNKFII